MSVAAASNPHAEEVCPWCEQQIPHERFVEVQARIAANERRRTEQLEASLREAYAAKTEELTNGFAAQVAEMKAAAAVEAAAAKLQAEADLQAAVIAARDAAAAESADAVREAQEARAAGQAALEQLKASQEEFLAGRLQAQREILDAAKAEELNAQKAEAFQERLAMTTKLEKLQRQLERKTADELGEGAEVDLYEELRREFPTDNIQRVKRGEQGADIVHRVMEGGRECGVIVYDSKNHSAWQSRFATKLASDKLAAKADHAILATRAFPAGTSQLAVREGVLLANPARVVALVQVMRKSMVHIATIRLSEGAREQKMQELYAFITSERYAQFLEHIDEQTRALFEMDVKEKRAHDLVWKKRGEALNSLDKSRASLSLEVDRILTATVVPIQRAT